MYLRNLEDKDITGILEWMKDDAINQYFQFDSSDADEEKIKQFIIDSSQNNKVHLAVVNDKDDYLGTISLKNINFKAKNAEYAIAMRIIAQGTGAAKYATDEILKKAFLELKLERVYLNVLTENKRADHFYKKYGFVYEGEFIKHISVKGDLKSIKWYRLLKREFLNLEYYCGLCLDT